MSFLSLYPELLLYLSQYLNRNECKSMRLTCKTLANVFALVVVTKVNIDTRKENFMEAIDILSGRSSVAKPPVHAIRKLNLVHRAHDSTFGEPDQDISEFLDVDHEDLLTALSSLVKIREIRWELNNRDPELSGQVGAILSSYPEISSLEVILYNCVSMPILRRFRNLETISYWAALTGTHADMSIHDIGQALAQSPALRDIFLLMSQQAYYSGIDEIMAPLEKAGVRLSLQNVTIKLCESALPLLPHLQHLKVLTMHIGQRNPLASRKYLDEFWERMTDMNVELEEIFVDHAPDALVGYLQHYQGLRSFRFDTLNNQSDAEKRRMFGTCGRELYCEGLPFHSLTLKKVLIRTQYEDGWGWSPEIQPGLAKCTALEHLGIGVTYGQLQDSCPIEANSECRPPIHLLIESIAQQCCSVRVLELYSEFPAHESHGNFHFIVRNTWKMIEKSITSYVASAETKSLPQIFVKQRQRNRSKCFVASTGKPLSYEMEVGHK